MAKQSEKPLQPVYLIHGKEPFLLEEALARLKARLEKESSVGLDVTVFTGALVDPKEIVSVLDTLPLMSERRLVIVKEAEKLPSTAEAALLDYVRHPCERSCLVLVFNDIKKDRGLYKALKVKHQVFEYELARGKYPLWIQDRFAKRNKQLEAEGTAYLLQETGLDLGRLANEIEKICLFYDDKESISVEEIRDIISAGREIGVYDFVDALAGRNPSQALVLLRRLLEKDEKGTGVFYPLLRHFKGLLKAKAYWEKGVRGQELYRGLKVSPFLAKKYESQIKNFSLEELKRIYLYLAETDFSAKSDKREMSLSLEILTSRIGREGR